MSLWTTSTTGLETALAAAIGSTLQQHTNSITNNLKGQPHILHIRNTVGGSVGSNLHSSGNLHTNSNNNNISINHLQHHLNHNTNQNHNNNHHLNSKWANILNFRRETLVFRIFFSLVFPQLDHQ